MESREAATRLAKLSAREAEVLELMVLGLASKQIAERLAIALPTVCVYRERIYSKLGVNSLAPAVRLAVLGKHIAAVLSSKHLT